MRLFIVPLILIGLLVQAPTTAFGNANQRAAERIADAIGERFPDADVDVSFRGGQVWLKGEATSQSQRERIVEHIFRIPGINVTEVNDEIQIVSSGRSADESAQLARPAAPVALAPAPVPNAPGPVPNAPGPRSPVAALNQARQMSQAQAQQQQMQQHMQAQQMPPAPQQHHSVYGLQPGQPSAFPAPFAQTAFVQHPHPQMIMQQQQPLPIQAMHHPAHAHHAHAHHGQHRPFPGQFNQPNLPQHAWPSYAHYPNFAQVSYPRVYSPRAWPYIGPFYPYPQVPLGWRRVTLEFSNGSWWLDFDDGSPSGPFSGLFRQPIRYTY